MTLKGFHIVFITFSTLLAIGVGAWCVSVDRMAHSHAYMAGAVLAFGTAAGLLVYGVWFWRKMKRLRIFT